MGVKPSRATSMCVACLLADVITTRIRASSTGQKPLQKHKPLRCNRMLCRQVMNEAMIGNKGIQYPYAHDDRNVVVPIANAIQGVRYLCIGCGQRMTAKKGRVRQPHFAHVPPFEHCDRDTALHTTAIELICWKFTFENSYRLGWCCVECGNEFSRDVRSEQSSAKIRKEHALVPNTKSDMVIEIGNRAGVILEVVVSHPMDAATEDRYIASDFPVLSKTISEWDDLKALEASFIADYTLNIPDEDYIARREPELAKPWRIAASWVLCNSCKEPKFVEAMKRHEAYTRRKMEMEREQWRNARLADARRAHQDANNLNAWGQKYKNNDLLKEANAAREYARHLEERAASDDPFALDSEFNMMGYSIFSPPPENAPDARRMGARLNQSNQLNQMNRTYHIDKFLKRQ